jgi:hypothetical protein
MRLNVLTSFEFVLCPAIRAFCFTVFSNVKEDSRVVVPKLHTGELAWAKNTALRIQVFGIELDGWFHQIKPWSANGRIWGCAR